MAHLILQTMAFIIVATFAAKVAFAGNQVYIPPANINLIYTCVNMQRGEILQRRVNLSRAHSPMALFYSENPMVHSNCNANQKKASDLKINHDGSSVCKIKSSDGRLVTYTFIDTGGQPTKVIELNTRDNSFHAEYECKIERPYSGGLDSLPKAYRNMIRGNVGDYSFTQEVRQASASYFKKIEALIEEARETAGQLTKPHQKHHKGSLLDQARGLAAQALH